MPVGIALGSNLGESEKLFQECIAELQKIHEGSLATFLVSSFYVTEPVDCLPDARWFLNAVVQLETKRSPLELIEFLQQIEMKAGRPFPRLRNASRTLDLDLLYHYSTNMLTPVLELPHPRIRERVFVLKPLAEINPNLILSGWEKTALEYLKKLEQS